LLIPGRGEAATQSGATVRTTATGLFRFAEAAMSKGDIETAEKAYRALSSDALAEIRAEARFRLALIESKRGHLTKAATLLRQVLDEKPNATPARLRLAQLLDTMGDQDGAWKEVRAAQASGLPPDVARIIDRWSDALRAARPIGASFEVALAPDSNISRSTRSDTLGTIFGEFEIDEDSKAKSGLGLSIRGQAFRRFDLRGEASLLARVSGSADLYRQSRFDDMALDLAVGPELQLGRNRVTIEAGATQRWFGLEPYMRSGRLEASIRRPLNTRTQLRLSASAALLDNQANDLQDGKSYSLRAGIERALSATTGVALNLSTDRLSAKDPAYSTTGWRAGLFAWRDVGRTTLTAGAELGRLRADERLALLPEARRDKLSRLTFGATFRQLTLGGFAPVTRLVIERNRSTVEFYDYSRTRTEFALVRAF
jgi:hypothetical protein